MAYLWGKRPPIADVVRDYGVDPREVGIKNRGWCIAEDGCLCVHTRDAGAEEFDIDVMVLPNYAGLRQDDVDPWEVDYVFRKLG